jgi:hypothetical protein
LYVTDSSRSLLVIGIGIGIDIGIGVIFRISSARRNAPVTQALLDGAVPLRGRTSWYWSTMANLVRLNPSVIYHVEALGMLGCMSFNIHLSVCIDY